MRKGGDEGLGNRDQVKVQSSDIMVNGKMTFIFNEETGKLSPIRCHSERIRTRRISFAVLQLTEIWNN